MHKNYKRAIEATKHTLLFTFTFLLMSFGVLSSATYADYECGTYGAGNYNSSDYQNTSDCTTTSTTSSGGTTNTTTVDAVATTPDTVTPTEDVTQQASILLNDYPEYSNGAVKTLGVTQDQVIHFTLKSQPHTITIKSINDQTVTVTVASTPHDVIIQKGQTVNDDVDGDGVKDIAISYFSSNVSVASVGFRQLPVEAAAVTTPTKVTPSYLWILWVALGLLVVAIIIVIIIVRIRKKKYTTMNPILPN